jgi:hypothetical protein
MSRNDDRITVAHFSDSFSCLTHQMLSKFIDFVAIYEFNWENNTIIWIIYYFVLAFIYLLIC